MTRDHLTGFWPFRLIPLDADTGKPLDANIGQKRVVTYYDIKKDQSGRRSIVAHKSPAPSAAGGNAKNDTVKKDDGDGKGKGKNGNGGGGEKKNGDGDKPNDKANKGEWRSEEDDKLRSMKKDNTPWKVIAEELKRSQGECKTHWKEIEGKGDAGKTEEKKGGDEKAEEKKDEGGKNDGNGDGGKGKTKNPNSPDREWTAEDDATLKKMKGEGKTDKEIAKALKRPQPIINKRWDEIGGSADASKDDKPKSERKKTSEPKPKSDKPAKAPSKAGSTRSEARFTMGQWLTLQEDSLFSFGELQCLSELIMKDSNLTWLRIAASFYDKTGRRVHPDDIRDKFEEMARMG